MGDLISDGQVGDLGTTEGDELWFEWIGAGVDKTKVWWVSPKDGSNRIGMVKWNAQWEKYAFYSERGSAFEEKLLREIGDFIEWATYNHQQGRRCSVPSSSSS